MSERGRPTKYEPAFARVAGDLHERGAVATEICKAIGIHEATFYRWKQQHREFCESVGGEHIARENGSPPSTTARQHASVPADSEVRRRVENLRRARSW